MFAPLAKGGVVFVEQTADLIANANDKKLIDAMEKLLKTSGALVIFSGSTAEIEAFFAANPMPQNKRKVEQTLEGIRTNAGFLKRVQAQLAEDRSWVVL